MVKTNLAALQRNRLLKDLKNSHAVKKYKGLVKKVISTNEKALKRQMLIERNLVNYKILSVRVLNKLESLSSVEKKKALSILNKVYNKLNLLEEKNCCLQYYEFSKVFAEKINRKKGQEVFDILIDLSKKYI